MTPHQNIDRLEDWVAETTESITARLEGAKASQAQIRLTIGVMAVISMMMLIASYNAYLSYDYGWTLKVTDSQLVDEKRRKDRLKAAAEEGPERQRAVEKEETERQLAAEKAVAGVLTEQALRDWASSRIVQISLLGIRVSVDDAAVLGSAVLFVLSLWLLLVARRENHTIGFLLRNTDTPNPDDNRDSSVVRSTENPRNMYSGGVRWLIFHTIISNSIFVTFDGSLSSVQSLKGRNPLKASTPGGFKGWLNKVGFGLVRSFFFFFPVIASLTVFILDRYSYRWRDPFLPEGAVEGVDRPFYLVSQAVFVVCWILLAVCCWRSSQYSKATEKVLREYGDKLRVDLKQQRQSA